MGDARTDAAIVAGLRAGDEAVFGRLLNDWSRSMLMLARTFVATQASAEEVVQDTWLAVIQGIGGFEGRSTVRTWVYRILINIAKKRAVRETRTVPWSSLLIDGTENTEGPTVDPARFRGIDDPYPGGWISFPQSWPSTEGEILNKELYTYVRAAIDDLPAHQRTVITLRDVLGHSSDEVCDLLEISPGNQRVLLHRGRAAVRARLAAYLVHEPSSDATEQPRAGS